MSSEEDPCGVRSGEYALDTEGHGRTLYFALDWSSNVTFSLIQLLKDRPQLWNPEHEWYFRQNKKQDSIKYIAKAVDKSGEYDLM